VDDDGRRDQGHEGSRRPSFSIATVAVTAGGSYGQSEIKIKIGIRTGIGICSGADPSPSPSHRTEWFVRKIPFTLYNESYAEYSYIHMHSLTCHFQCIEMDYVLETVPSQQHRRVNNRPVYEHAHNQPIQCDGCFARASGPDDSIRGSSVLLALRSSRGRLAGYET